MLQSIILALLGGAVASAVLFFGGVVPGTWNISLFSIAVLAIFFKGHAIAPGAPRHGSRPDRRIAPGVTAGANQYERPVPAEAGIPAGSQDKIPPDKPGIRCLLNVDLYFSVITWIRRENDDFRAEAA